MASSDGLVKHRSRLLMASQSHRARCSAVLTPAAAAHTVSLQRLFQFVVCGLKTSYLLFKCGQLCKENAAAQSQWPKRVAFLFTGRL